MNNNGTLQSMRAFCRHFIGPARWESNRTHGARQCLAGKTYAEVAKTAQLGRWGCAVRAPCSDGIAKEGCACDKYEPYTAKELLEQEKEFDRVMDCMKRQVSECCESPYDEHQVIKEGEYKGHGTRYCSKCGKPLFRV